MKLSLAWLFDHIDADWQKIDVAALIHLFNQTTAEIEGWHKVTFDFDNLSIGTLEKINETVSVYLPELKKTIQLPSKEGIAVGQLHLVIKKETQYEWATVADLGSDKEGNLPALSCDQKLLEGGWKKNLPAYDYIIHLDNKSVNHRPDMWGHRGVAREVAAMLNLPFKALDGMLIARDVKNYESSAPANALNPMSIRVESAACTYFSGLSLDRVENKPSPVAMALRLACVDSKPINAVVDSTNYVMLDLGQPMHAFDAGALQSSSIIVRDARTKKSLALLDGTTVELTAQDCVIATDKKPVALAGIMGGKESAVSLQTTSLFLEAACFDATAIRKSSARVKKRTEASARFEKSLDPSAGIVALERFTYLLSENNISFHAADAIISIGTLPEIKKIILTHSFIEQRLGISLAPEFIQKTLTVLDFGVNYTHGEYHITVPTFRATKDVAIKEDIVEEIGRFYGYSVIPEQLPLKRTNPFDISCVERLRAIKQLLAYGLCMQEVATYAFFDESFLSVLEWQPEKTLQVQEPVSENWQRLVTTLLPNLLKIVHANSQQRDHMSFFEWARIWIDGTEQQSLAGIFVDQKHPILFYDAKLMISRIFESIGLTDVQWIKPQHALEPWYLPYQTAYLMHDEKKIGIFGKIDPLYFSKIASGDACIFELDADFLLTYRKPIHRYTAPSKFPSITRDISMLGPLAITVAQVKELIASADPLITHVTLVDFFEKAEWKDRKSLTFSVCIQDQQKTLTAPEADLVLLKITQKLEAIGATIR